MLVETLMARDDNPSFDELVALAVETGREGVKALKAKPVEKAAPAPVQAAAPKAAAPLKPMGPNDYMVIGLARIDDRLIHGTRSPLAGLKKPTFPALSSSATKLRRIPYVKRC